jgi:chromosome partitioning protein
MLAVDVVLTPLRASQADLETLPAMAEMVAAARDYNPALKAFAVLSMAPTNPLITEVKDAQELLVDINGITLAGGVIRDRKVFRDAMIQGAGVVESTNSQAAAEVQLLIDEFFVTEGEGV